MKTLVQLMLNSLLFIFLTTNLSLPPKTGSTVSINNTSSPPIDKFTWDINTIDIHGGFESELSLDGNGNPIIAYQATIESIHQLNLARWTGEDWIVNVIDGAGDTGWVVPSIVLDNEGNPVVGYSTCNSYGCALQYAHWANSDWVVESAPGDPDSFGSSGATFTIDSNGYPRFSYCTQDRTSMQTELMYEYWTGTTWSTEVVDATGCWYSTSLKLDENEHPGISYYDDTYGRLKYAHWTGSGWSVEVVDANGNTGRPNSLALDSEGHPHISYFSFTYNKLKYAEWTGSNWVISNVDDIGGPLNFMDISLVLNAGDQPHIAYIDANTGNVKYSYWTGDAWSKNTVGSGAYSVTVRLDDVGNPHISYQSPNFEVKYAVGHQLVFSNFIYFPFVSVPIPPPSNFYKTRPADHSINQSLLGLTIAWTASDSENGYEYCIDTLDNNSCDTEWSYDIMQYWDPSLLLDTTYYWQVRTTGAGGTTYADNGEWWTFSTTWAAKTGFWADPSTGTRFFVKRNNNEQLISGFAIPVQFPCGVYWIYRTIPDQDVSFNGLYTFAFEQNFYGEGTIDSRTTAHGTTGFRSIYMCGSYWSLGPVNWNASWIDGSQPTISQATSGMSSSALPETISPFKAEPVK